MTNDADTARYTIAFEQATGVLVCRLHGFLHDGAAARFARDVSAAIHRVRTADMPLLYLVDNREGRVVSPTVAQSLAAVLADAKRPGDRTAIIVSDSLSKMQAKRVTTSAHEVFVSEHAARTWLTAFTSAGATGATSVERA